MIELTKEQLIERIALFEDSKVICEQLNILAEDDYSDGNLYWLKEAQESINGMFELLMDLKKQHMMDGSTKTNTDTLDLTLTPLSLTMDELHLSKMAIDVLKAINMNTVIKLINTGEKELKVAIKNYDPRNYIQIFEEVKYSLEGHGLAIGFGLYQ